MFGGCCRLFRSFPPEDYEPIATSTETTFSKTVVPSSGEKQPLKNNEKKSSKTNVNNIPQAEEAKEDSLPFEQDLLFNTVLVNSKIKYAAIATFPDGTVKAANFPVRKKGVKHIVEAFKGNSEDLAEHGMKLSSDLPVYTPGKMDEGKAIYGRLISNEDDDQNSKNDGGCTVMKSKSYVLITTYKNNDHFEQVEQFSSGIIKKLERMGK